MKYEVQVDGKTVFSEETSDDTFDREVIPAEYRCRPEGLSEVVILTDDEVIAVNRAENNPTPAAITGSGGAVAENATGSGG